MKCVMSILLAAIAGLCLVQCAAYGQTNTATNTVVDPPPWSPPAPPYTVDDIGSTNTVKVYPFLLCYGVRDDGTYIFQPPEDWQIAKQEPTTTTIRLKFYDRLDTNATYSIEFTCPRNAAFAGWEIIEQ